MISLRPFVLEDWQTISLFQYPNLSETDIKHLISDFNSGFSNGRRIEMLAVEADGMLVGYVSLLDLGNGIASEGVEIYPPYRRRGYAFSALKMLLEQSSDYRMVTAQIRQDNSASLALHEKLGFTVTDSFTNRRGHPVYSLALSL